MGLYRSITTECHARLAQHLRAGDTAVDATAGNGHDTVALARFVGAKGRVYAIDLQETAIAATALRLREADLLERVTLLRGNHAGLAKLIPASAAPLAAVVFNLGYLPGGDKARTTTSSTTLAALTAALERLSPRGAISIVCYPGHPEGAREAEAVHAACEALAAGGRLRIEKILPAPTRRPAPFLLWLSPLSREPN